MPFYSGTQSIFDNSLAPFKAKCEDVVAPSRRDLNLATVTKVTAFEFFESCCLGNLKL